MGKWAQATLWRLIALHAILPVPSLRHLWTVRTPFQLDVEFEAKDMSQRRREGLDGVASPAAVIFGVFCSFVGRRYKDKQESGPYKSLCATLFVHCL